MRRLHPSMSLLALLSACTAPPVVGTHVPTASGDVVLNTTITRAGGEPLRAGVDYAEWWTRRGVGAEQGWTLPTRPSGAGPLVVTVTVDGAGQPAAPGRGPATGGTLALQSAHGGAVAAGALAASGIRAWDADGADLPVYAQLAGADLRLTVDDAGARYPVVVDPVYTAASTVLDGSGASQFGTVVGIGDVNGDGYDDVAVGAPSFNSSAGRVYVYLGSAAGTSTTAATTLTGEAAGDRLGSAVAGAGDVNGDGYDDLVLGANAHNTETGIVYVYHGSSGGLLSTPATTLNGPASYYNYGYAVAGIGDVNGDGLDDIITSAISADSNAGRVYAYYGSSAGITTTGVTALYGEAGGDLFGKSLSAAGDMTGDGYDDVLVAAPNHSANAGKVYLYAGSHSGLNMYAVASLSGEAGENGFGTSISALGDVNGDGRDDVMIGAPGYNSGQGRAYVYEGAGSSLPTSAVLTLTGEAVGDAYGAVAGAGDVNGDGYDDIVVGAPGHAAGDGRAYVYEGSASGPVAAAASTLDGEGGAFGTAVDGAGDTNGDGYADVIVGAPGLGGNAGRAYVYGGFVDVDADGDGLGVSVDCDDADATVGGATQLPVDADGDGYGDMTLTGAGCPGTAGYADDATDCNDADPNINPGAAEVCDVANADENCNGLVDDADPSATGQATVYSDADGDGYEGTPAAFCDPPASGYSATSPDCDDTDPDVHPGVDDVEGDNVDDNCDGVDGIDVGPAPDDTGSSRTDCGCAATPDGWSGGLLLVAAAGLMARRRR